MPKFAHIRLRNSDGSIACKGGITIAFEDLGDPDFFSYALAFCHEQDNYNKKIGRAKAAGRLLSPRWRMVTNAASTSDLISKILENIPVQWVHIDSPS